LKKTSTRHPLMQILLLLWIFAWMGTGIVLADAGSPTKTNPNQFSAGEGETYRVQVAAYFSARRAKKAKKKIAKDERFKDLKTVIEFSAKSGVYRVEVGAFSSAEEAEVLRSQLNDAGFNDAEVVVDRFSANIPASASAPAAGPPVDAANTVNPPETLPVTPDDHQQEPTAAAMPAIGQVGGATQRSDYIIGPEDLLEISVFELEGLNKTVRVSEEGVISLPLLGDVRAEGKTRGQLEETVRALLEEKYINNPQVSVFIREYRSRSVSLIGSIQKPGTYKLLGTRTLIHMISEAGGLTDRAGPDLYLIRVGSDGSSQRITVNIHAMMIEGRPELNLLVQAGDVINVPPDPEMSVYIYGAVRQPGELSFKKSDVISLLQAITKAGGLTDRAAAERVRIKRKTASGQEVQIDINLKKILKGKIEDAPLQDKDVVVVPETIF